MRDYFFTLEFSNGAKRSDTAVADLLSTEIQIILMSPAIACDGISEAQVRERLRLELFIRSLGLSSKRGN